MKTYKRWLQNANLKVTPARLNILYTLDHANGFLTAEDIYNELKPTIEHLSLSTIYRSLEQLEKVHLIESVSLENKKEAQYELAHSKHAHHLICLTCGKVIHIHDCPIHDFAKAVSSQHHFKVTSHTLDLYGYCEACQT